MDAEQKKLVKRKRWSLAFSICCTLVVFIGIDGYLRFGSTIRLVLVFWNALGASLNFYSYLESKRKLKARRSPPPKLMTDRQRRLAEVKPKYEPVFNPSHYRPLQWKD